MSDSKSRRSWIADHIAGLPRSGIRDFFELVMSMDDVISLGVGEPDFDTPWGIREATIHALEKGRTSYTSNLGLLQAREAICDYCTPHFGIQYNPKTECIVTVGVSEALDLALRAILNPGDEVVYHEPCYVSYSPSIRMCHATPVAVTTKQADNFALDPEALAAAITPRTKAILLNFPNNPTGANLSPEQKQRIAEIAIERDVLVLTDEIYSELTYGPISPSIASLPGMKERTILLHGFSKAFAMTGYRIGYACGPQVLIEAMMKIHQYSMLCASIMGQDAAIEACRNGRPAMEHMRFEYEQRRNVIVNRLNKMGLTCAKPEGAFYAYPSIASTGLDSAEFAKRLLMEEKVAVVPGSAFSSDGASYIRCAYATRIEVIEEAMDRMAAFIGRL